MSNQSKAEERRTEIALFRYTLILPILRETSARARQQMRRNIAAVVYDIPHSKRRRVSVTGSPICANSDRSSPKTLTAICDLTPDSSSSTRIWIGWV